MDDIFDLLIFVTKKNNIVVRIGKNEKGGSVRVHFWRVNCYNVTHFPELILSNDRPLRQLVMKIDADIISYWSPCGKVKERLFRRGKSYIDCVEMCVRKTLTDVSLLDEKRPTGWNITILDDLTFDVGTFTVNRGLVNIRSHFKSLRRKDNLVVVPFGSDERGLNWQKIDLVLPNGNILLGKGEVDLMKMAYFWMFGDRVVLLDGLEHKDGVSCKGKYVYYYDQNKKIKFDGFC